MIKWKVTSFNCLTNKCQCCPHIGTSQLICCAKQLTGFYMRAILALNGSNRQHSLMLTSVEIAVRIVTCKIDTFSNSIFLGQTFVRTKFCSRPLKGKVSLTFIGFVLRGIQNQASNMQNFMETNFCLTYYGSMLLFYALWKYCNVFSRYRKWTLAWNGLISQLTNNVSFVGILSEWVNIYSLIGGRGMVWHWKTSCCTCRITP